MSRVLLFVVPAFGEHVLCCGEASADRKRRGIAVGSEDDSARDWFVTLRARRMKDAADRWWLVECENAEAGRAIIANAAKFDSDPTLKNLRGLGRILASGGKP